MKLMHLWIFRMAASVISRERCTNFLLILPGFPFPPFPFTGCDVPGMPSSRGEKLDDLESIVNQPPPALGAPAGVSLPIFMNCDRSNSGGFSQVALAAATTARVAATRHRSTRTVSVDTLEELCQVLGSGESNQEWEPVKSRSSSMSTTPSSGEDELPSYPPSPGQRSALVGLENCSRGGSLLRAL